MSSKVLKKNIRLNQRAHRTEIEKFQLVIEREQVTRKKQKESKSISY